MGIGFHVYNGRVQLKRLSKLLNGLMRPKTKGKCINELIGPPVWSAFLGARLT